MAPCNVVETVELYVNLMPPSSGYKSGLPQQAPLKISKFVPDSVFYSRRQYQFS